MAAAVAEVGLPVLGENVSLEYVRDSPDWRKQLSLFVSTQCAGGSVPPYARSVHEALEYYVAKARDAVQAGKILAGALHPSGGRSSDTREHGANVSRALYSSCHKQVQDVSQSLAETSRFLHSVMEAQEGFVDTLNKTLAPELEVIVEDDLSVEKQLKKQMGKLGEDYADTMLRYLSKVKFDESESAQGSEPPTTAQSLSGATSSSVSSPTTADSAARESGKSGGGSDRSASTRAPPARRVTCSMSEIEQQEALMLRMQFELTRFDLVRSINAFEVLKKLRLTGVVVNTAQACVQYSDTLNMLAHSRRQWCTGLASDLANAQATRQMEDVTWEHVRSRLQAELHGALPPPGAPPGALSPVAPRTEEDVNAAPPFAATLTTEVLTEQTKKASTSDNRHARDEGVLKQGWLVYSAGLLGRRRREWLRLHGGKLFRIVTTDSQPLLMCDVTQAKVMPNVPGPGRTTRDLLPFSFAVDPGGGADVLQLQAENHEEMEKWMSAIRRCAVLHRLTDWLALPTWQGAREAARSRRIKREQLQAEAKVKDEATSPATAGEAEGQPADRGNASVTSESRSGSWHAWRLSSQVVTGRTSEQLASMLALGENARCAECSAEPVVWMSVNLGVTLCDTCANCHRLMGRNISVLRSVDLDEHAPETVVMLATYLGNVNGKNVWERCIARDWNKPVPDSPQEQKQAWVSAKYEWFGFVEEFRPRNRAQLLQGLMEAATSGSVRRAGWWLAHRSPINGRDPFRGGGTALHAACRSLQPLMSLYLILNGADIYAVDDQGVSPVDIADEFVRELGFDSSSFAQLALENDWQSWATRQLSQSAEYQPQMRGPVIEPRYTPRGDAERPPVQAPDGADTEAEEEAGADEGAEARPDTEQKHQADKPATSGASADTGAGGQAVDEEGEPQDLPAEPQGALADLSAEDRIKLLYRVLLLAQADEL